MISNLVLVGDDMSMSSSISLAKIGKKRKTKLRICMVYIDRYRERRRIKSYATSATPAPTLGLPVV